MSRIGISPQEFVERIHDADNVVDHWPFAYLPDQTRYQGLESPINEYTRGRAIKTLFVGSVYEARNGRPPKVKFSQRKSGHYDNPIQLTAKIADTDVNVWRQMTDVQLSVNLELGEAPRYGATERDVIIDRILGVEQPLRTSNPVGRTPIAGSQNSGYIHGEVLANAESNYGSSDQLPIRLGREATRSLIILHSGISLGRVERSNNVNEYSLVTGDIIRGRVHRGYGDIFHNDDRMFLLNRPGEA